MAKARALDKRRKSIRNIRKITRTMELIATARLKRAMNRAIAVSDYTRRITAIVSDLARSGLEMSHPLLEGRPASHRTLLVLTANRGLCGGYNASVIRLAQAHWREMQSDIPTLLVSGKRGISTLRFRGIVPAETFTQFEDRPAFEEVEVLANRFIDAYQAGTLDRLDVAYTRFEGISRQEAVVETLLPLSRLAEEADKQAKKEDDGEIESHYEFLPSAESILDEIVPASFKVKLFKCFLDAAVSEQIARRVAMKAATDNADQMTSALTMAYNRARQGQITGEILEVISGAEAIQG